MAYQRSEGHQAVARVELERKTGHVTVWAAETDEDGTIAFCEWREQCREVNRQFRHSIPPAGQHCSETPRAAQPCRIKFL